MKLTLRKAKPSDHNFILATWLKSYRQHCTHKPVPNSEIYFREHQARIKDVLARGECLIASTDDSDQICGFMSYEGGTVHYVFVKAPFRRYGIANGLLDAITLTEFSHFTKYAPLFQRRGLQFNPYRF